MHKRAGLVASGLLSLVLLAPVARAWDAVGHRAITWLALDGLDKDAPAFLREEATRHAIAWQSAEPDRWRGVTSPILRHENAMDHYLDAEDLAAFGLTLETVNPLRYRFVRDMAVARHVHPSGPDESHKPYNEKFDPAGDKEYPGFVLHEITELHAKLISSFKTLRQLEAIGDPARAPQVAQARANIATVMGLLSHFVGDTAQPLHTTQHFNGWAGDNPHGYTTSKAFHSWIDGGVLFQHGLDYHTLKPTQTYQATVDGASPWAPTVAYFRRSFELVVPLYELEKSGELEREAGRAFIAARLNDAGAMLSAYYNSAWRASIIKLPNDVDDFARYDAFHPGQQPDATREQRDAWLNPAPTIGAPLPGRRVLLVGELQQASGFDGHAVLKLTDGELIMPLPRTHRTPAIGQRIAVAGRLYQYTLKAAEAPAAPSAPEGGYWAIAAEDWRPAPVPSAPVAQPK
jgi:hypothetical protein